MACCPAVLNAISRPRAPKTFFTALAAAALLSSVAETTAADASKLPPAASRKVDFAKEIQPILASRCYECHGPEKSKADYRLDMKEVAMRGGESEIQPILPGKSSESPLIHRVARLDPDDAMPPKGESLSAEQVGLLRAWIDQGAEWPQTTEARSSTQHWAFQPVVRMAPPRTKNRKWIRNSIDAFVLARLEKEGLKPSPEADRVTLIRRLSLDLTGLPPTPEEVDAFLADRSPEAYEKVVERLLASPHYGERWGRHWLDAARYADSNGFEKDRPRTIWPWRDWVISAFNRDLPFDQFTIEQLAGDLLPNATLQQRVATGFLRNSMINMEGGIEPEKFRTEAIIDRVDAVSRTWLGLTVACAQCHSHKYDPISQREYYQFYSFLNNDDEFRLEVPNDEQAAKRDQILTKVRAAEDRVMSETSDLVERMAKWERDIAGASGNWTVIDATEWHSQPMKFEKQEDGSLLGGGDIYPGGVLRVWWDTNATNITGFQLEALTDGNLPFTGPGIDGNGAFQLAEFTVEATPLSELSKPDAGSTNFVATTNKVVFSRALADAEVSTWSITNAIDGNIKNGGWANDFGPARRNHERRAVFQASESAGFDGGTRFLLTVYCKPDKSPFNSQLIGRVRLSYTTDSGDLEVDPLTTEQQRILAVAPEKRTAGQRRELFNVFRYTDPSFAAANKEIDELWSQWPAAQAVTLALSPRPIPRKTRMFKRGDWLRPGDEVQPEAPKVLHPFPADAPRNRLGLATWLVDRRNPLTPRVIVNRVWQAYFGQGFVTTPEDFGTRADPPSHPELLDWLASEFVKPKPAQVQSSRFKVQSGMPWSLKHIHRLIVNSATYRQSSRVTPELIENDPYNRLLARGPRFRVEGEIVYDIALKAAGLLNPKIGGPSVYPPLPEGVMQLAYSPMPWNESVGDDRYRRAMYTFWRRSVPFPTLLMFDAPTAEQSCARRVRSNTPLQALTTLNESTFVQAARWLAWRVAREGGETDEARAAYAFRLVLSRKPEAAELQSLLKLHEAAREEFASKPVEAASFAYADPKNPAPLPAGSTVQHLAAWAAVSRALLNLDETVTKE